MTPLQLIPVSQLIQLSEVFLGSLDDAQFHFTMITNFQGRESC